MLWYKMMKIKRNLQQRNFFPFFDKVSLCSGTRKIRLLPGQPISAQLNWSICYSKKVDFHGWPKEFELFGSVLAAAVPVCREVSQNKSCPCTKSSTLWWPHQFVFKSKIFFQPVIIFFYYFENFPICIREYLEWIFFSNFTYITK